MKRFLAAVDGGSRGNPGPAAWGVAILDEDGRPAEGHAGTLGRATNNVAEYRALIEALRLAAERDAESVEIRMDSELVVKQVDGRYKVRNAGLRPLWQEARTLLRAFALARVVHVRRERNTEADGLVNEVLDRQERDDEPVSLCVDLAAALEPDA